MWPRTLQMPLAAPELRGNNRANEAAGVDETDVGTNDDVNSIFEGQVHPGKLNVKEGCCVAG